MLHSQFSEQTLRAGPAVSLSCVASGNPPPSITWYLDDQQVSLTNQLDFLSQRQSNFMDRLVMGQYLGSMGRVISHLNISSVHSSDGGLYRCEASNSVGTVSHASRLNVYGPPNSRGVLNITAVARSDVLLICPVSGFPLHRVEWRVDNQLLAGPRPAPLKNGTLLIQVVSWANCFPQSYIKIQLLPNSNT